MESLVIVPVSQASAQQRAGRAGRLRPGKCYRLYTSAGFKSLAECSIPEMQRSNLAPLILQLKALGIHNILRFDYMTPPPSALMTRALEVLFSLGALNEQSELQYPAGLQMAEFPVDPLLAKTVFVL